MATTDDVDPLRCLADLLESQAVLLRAVADRTAKDKERDAGPPGAGLTIRAAARALGVSHRFVGNAVARQELRAERLGPRLYRIDPRELELFRKRRNLFYAVLR